VINLLIAAAVGSFNRSPISKHVHWGSGRTLAAFTSSAEPKRPGAAAFCHVIWEAHCQKPTFGGWFLHVGTKLGIVKKNEFANVCHVTQ